MRPQRLKATAPTTFFFASSDSAIGTFIGVRNGPGQIALTVMFHGASSRLNVLVIRTTAPLLAAYGERNARPTTPSVLATLTILPYFRDFMCGTTARVHSHTPPTLMSLTCWNCS